MQLHSEQPYWLMKEGIISTYNSLGEDVQVDVAIIGAGISGALTAYHLRNSGYSMAILERRHAGMGSTAASTAFLQYEIDTPLRKLSKMVGEQNAVQSYKLCKEAIYSIDKICKKLKPAFDFHIRPSLQYASYKKDEAGLYEEYKLRQKYGFKVRWLEPNELEEKFGLDAPAGILSVDGGEVNAYALTHALLGAVSKKGHKVYNNTNVAQIVQAKRHVILKTDEGVTVKAKKLIIAAGYESLKYIPKKIAEVHSTYALVSEPIADMQPWYKNSLVWETADPYMYFRMVDGNRVLAGGKDDPYHHARILPSVIKRKSKMLEEAFNKRMPHVPIKADLSWGGPFAVTKDGLPYIGTLNGKGNIYFALGFGGNGITFSVIAAEIIKDMIAGKKNKDADIFSFNR